jgi:hypothetical protein
MIYFASLWIIDYLLCLNINMYLYTYFGMLLVIALSNYIYIGSLSCQTMLLSFGDRK